MYLYKGQGDAQRFASSPEAPLLGELSSDSETERLYEGEPDREPQRNRTSPSRLRRATSPIEGRHWRAGKFPSSPKALPLGELSPKVTERARMPS